jgi:ABC-type hemin transport system ATPase subunit
MVISQIGLAVSRGIDSQSLLTTIGSIVGPNGQVRQVLMTVLSGASDFGREQVQEELARQ